MVSPEVSDHQKLGLPESCLDLDLVSEGSWSEATSSRRGSSGSSQLQHSLRASVPGEHAADICGVSNGNNRMRYFSKVVFVFMRWIPSPSFCRSTVPCGSRGDGSCWPPGPLGLAPSRVGVHPKWSGHKEFKDIHPFYLQGIGSSTYYRSSPLIQDGKAE